MNPAQSALWWELALNVALCAWCGVSKRGIRPEFWTQKCPPGVSRAGFGWRWDRQTIMPAPTVLLVDSSMRMNAPVARESA